MHRFGSFDIQTGGNPGVPDGKVAGCGKAEESLDWTVALNRVDGDNHLLGELASIFLQEYPHLLDEMRDSIARDDRTALERAAHTLKGRVAFFGINNVRDQAMELEMIGRVGNLEGARNKLADIETQMERIIPELGLLALEQRA
jgi:HPt (histidine-containing phosphotransfer) domain-containing protein